MRHLTLVDMKPSEFRTSMQVRKDLARVQQMSRIKGAFQTLLLLQIIFGELNVHQIALLDTNAVLAGEYTTHFNTASQDVGPEFFGALQFARLVGIKQDQRVEVAITGMEYIRHAKTVLPVSYTHLTLPTSPKV